MGAAIIGRAYALGAHLYFLGTRRLFARGRSRIQSCAFDSLLEYSAYGYIAFPDRASLVVGLSDI